MTHAFIHGIIRGLRQLFGLTNSVCSQCEEHRSREAEKLAALEALVETPVAVYAPEEVFTPHAKVHLSYDQLRSMEQGLVKDYASRAFTRWCQENGVECAITLDPTDVKRILHFRNVNTFPIEIIYQDQVITLKPDERGTIKIWDYRSVTESTLYPQVRALSSAPGINRSFFQYPGS